MKLRSAAPGNSPPYARSEVAEGRGGSLLRAASCAFVLFVVKRSRTTKPSNDTNQHESLSNRRRPEQRRIRLACVGDADSPEKESEWVE